MERDRTPKSLLKEVEDEIKKFYILLHDGGVTTSTREFRKCFGNLLGERLIASYGNLSFENPDILGDNAANVHTLSRMLQQFAVRNLADDQKFRNVFHKSVNCVIQDGLLDPVMQIIDDYPLPMVLEYQEKLRHKFANVDNSSDEDKDVTMEAAQSSSKSVLTSLFPKSPRSEEERKLPSSTIFVSQDKSNAEGSLYSFDEAVDVIKIVLNKLQEKIRVFGDIEDMFGSHLAERTVLYFLKRKQQKTEQDRTHLNSIKRTELRKQLIQYLKAHGTMLKFTTKFFMREPWKDPIYTFIDNEFLWPAQKEIEKYKEKSVIGKLTFALRQLSVPMKFRKRTSLNYIEKAEDPQPFESSTHEFSEAAESRLRHAERQRKYQESSEQYPNIHARAQKKYEESSVHYPELHSKSQQKYTQKHLDYSTLHAERQKKYRIRSADFYVKQRANRWRKLDALTGRNLLCDVPNEAIRPPVIVPPNYLGRRDQRCYWCGALHFKGERDCCDNGRIFIPPYPALPSPFDRLLLKDTYETRQFKKNILQYNACFAFGSIQYHHERCAAFGAQVIKARGSVNHFTSCIKPWDPKKPRYGNFYIYHGEQAVKARMEQALFCDLDENLIREITQSIVKNDPLARWYTMMGDRIKQEEAAGRDIDRLRLRIVDARTVNREQLQQHVKTYATDVQESEHSDFVAVFFTADTAQNVDYPGINVYPRLKGTPLPIFPWMPQIDALMYPLIFPRGEPGWKSKAFPIWKDRRDSYITRLKKYRNENPRKASLWPFTPEELELKWPPLLHEEGDPNIARIEEVSEGEDEEKDENMEEGYYDSQHENTFSSKRTADPQGLAVESDIVMEERLGELYPVRLEAKSANQNEQSTSNVFTQNEDSEDELCPDEVEDQPTPDDLELDMMLNELVTKLGAEVSLSSPEHQTEAVSSSDGQAEKKEPQHRMFASFLEYAHYLLQKRDDHDNRLSAGGKLTQLMTVDWCTRLNHFRTQEIREHHTQYTTTEFHEFVNEMQFRMNKRTTARGEPPRTIGCITSIPSTVPGSPRNLMEKFENACVLTNELGPPDLFLTFTANTGWKEIKENLKPGQVWSDDPELVNRIFKQKLNLFLNRVLGEPIKGNKSHRLPGKFGTVSWAVYSIEFQARGPPHAHIIISLHQHIRTAAEVDKVCQAYIPKLPDEDTTDPVEYAKIKRLREIIVKYMIHRPCDQDREAYCKVGTPAHWKTCRKNFPKEFSDITRLDDTDYPHLRRPDDGEGEYIPTQGREQDPWADNRWVVPTNHELISEFECHLNVEVISSLRVLKYIYKYLFKGFDRVLVEAITNLAGDTVSADMTLTGHIFHPRSINLPSGVIRARNIEAEKRLLANNVSLTDTNGRATTVYDETTIAEDQRVLTPCEAAWTLAKYPRSFSTHTVVQMFVHEPRGERVVIIPGEEEDLLKRIKNKGIDSRLKAWFKLNQKLINDNKEDELQTFRDVPLHYKYENGRFRKRGKEEKFLRGHVKQVNPRNVELFAIRLLSMNCKGFTSFEDMRTVGTVTYDTFAEAAQKRRLMNDQEEWFNAIEEAAADKMPKVLRRLFSTILIFCAVINPRDLWDRTKNYLFENRRDWDTNRKQAHALFHIKSILKQYGDSLEKYHLPEIDDEHLPEDDELTDDSKGDTMPLSKAQKCAEGMFSRMNDEQKVVFKKITESVMSNKKESFFVHGQGGSGKTYVYKALYYYFRGKVMKVETVAHTGVAAMLLPFGSTAHSAFKIPLTVEENMHCKIKLHKEEAEALRNVSVVLWDEAPMTDRRIFEAVHELLIEIHKDDPLAKTRKFAGITFVLGGDFRQTLPIVPGIRGSGVLDYTIRRSELWNHLIHLHLYQNVRAQGDLQYAKLVLSVGDGTANINRNAEEENQLVKIPSDMLVNSEAALIEHFFGRIDDPNRKILKRHIVETTSILTVDNKTTFEINEKVLRLLPGEERTYKSNDVFDETKGLSSVDPEFYNVATPSGLPPHNLQLKVGAVVMLLRNISVRHGLVNGTRIILTKLGEDILTGIRIRPGKHYKEGEKEEEEVLLHRMRLTTSTDVHCKELAFARWQFPVRLAFAITCNKAQGQTLDHAGLVLRTPVFAHGQLYVALSRVRTSNDMKIYNANENASETINVVHRHALV